MRIETERLVIRDFAESDFDAVYSYGSDPEVVRYMPFPLSTHATTREHIARCIAQAGEQPRSWYDMGVELRDEHVIIGGINVHVSDAKHGRANFAYLFNRKYWGHGYATEALAAMLRFGFETLGLREVEDSCDSENIASARVMEKCGLTLFSERAGERNYKLTAEEWKRSMSDSKA